MSYNYITYLCKQSRNMIVVGRGYIIEECTVPPEAKILRFLWVIILENVFLARSRLYESTQIPLLCAFEITSSLQFTPKNPHFFKVPQNFRLDPGPRGG